MHEGVSDGAPTDAVDATWHDGVFVESSMDKVIAAGLSLSKM